MTIRPRRVAHRRSLRPLAERMEPRSLLNGAWGGYAGNAQHTAISPVASQPLEAIRWQAKVDLNPQYSGGDLFIHYGSPAVTSAGTLLLPVKTGATSGFEVQGRKETDGSLLWTIPTNYVLPPHGWIPSYTPAITASGGLAMPELGGRINIVDAPDSAGAKVSRTIAFFGQMNYDANPSAYDSNVFISTPVTADSAGNLYFGFKVTGSTPIGLQSGIARIASDGTGRFVSATGAAGDAGINEVVLNAAPAVSNDGKTVYVAVSTGNQGDLLALDGKTLATTGKVALMDPKSGSPAGLPDDGTASPLVGPDGDVFFGVLENPFPSNHDRGWLLHFDATLTQAKTVGAFGWDDTASIVPKTMVPGYSGPSSYLLMAKYNNYAGRGGDGENRLAVLDPNVAAIDPVSGQNAMKPVLSIVGATPDAEFVSAHAFAVREWCINTAVVDPATDSVLANSEDGKLYRWDLSTNTFSQVITLTGGVGEAYTPTIIGPDGAVFAINNATLFAVGSSAPSASADSFTVAQDGKLTVAAPGVLANDHGGPGLTLTATLATGPAHGILGLSTDGSFAYTPTPGYTGPDGFTYTVRDGALSSAPASVTLAVTPVNPPPVAQADTYNVNEDGKLTLAAPGVLGNDSGTSLSAILALAPSHGTLTFLADGSFTYTPTPLYSGSDSFAYRITDGKATSANATVAITVNPVLHAPTSVPDSFTVAQDGKLTIAAKGVLANDTVVDPGVMLTAEVVSGPTHGTLSLAADGSFTYSPASSYRGADSFTYHAKNGVLVGNTATASIVVSPVNHPPVGVDDSYGTAEDSPLVIFAANGVLANDTDSDPGTTLSAMLAFGPTHGTLSLNPDGSFLYKPDANFHGIDGFSYFPSDGTAQATESVAVPIVVSAVNDVPVATGKTISAVQGRPSIAEAVLATFNDPDNQAPASYSATIDWGDGSPVSAGNVSGASGSFRVTASHVYDATGGFVAKVTITDSAGGTATAVTGVNVAPIGVGLSGAILDGGNHSASGALVTNITTPTVAGTAPAGFVVTLFAGGTSIGQATAGADNTFRIVASPLTNGAFDLSLKATTTVPGSALNFSASAGSIVVDTSAPRIVSAVFNLKAGTVTVTFQDGGSGLDSASPLSAGAFTITQTIKGKRTTIPVASIAPTGFASGSGSAVVTLTLRKTKLPKGAYTVKVAPGVVRDLAGNTLATAEVAARGTTPHPRGQIGAFASHRA